MSAAVARPRGLLPATSARLGPSRQKLLHIDSAGARLHVTHLSALPSLIDAGDVLVLNDAATLPASLAVEHSSGRRLEIRLAQATTRGTWWAVLFGEGSWRDDTDRRPAPPRLSRGTQLRLADGSALRVVRPLGPRLYEVRFPTAGAAFFGQLYRLGRPVQYSYHRRALDLADVQTPYAARPWAMEMPSAGRPLTASLLHALERTGVHVHTLTHAAGLSATGDPTLDRRLPLPERFHIPASTAEAVERAKNDGRRVWAVGTSVTRALEGVARERGQVVAGDGETDLRIGPATAIRVVDALLTGAHDPSSSHHRLLEAFASARLLADALERSVEQGFRGHELGDSWLIT